jgi:16S rRNA (cytidine1402-2'-O)-methyltransferase
VPALVASGIPCDAFHYEGFLPHKKGRQTRLKYLAALENTFVLYESPHRLLRCLEELATHCGPERMACVARELSKKHEEVKTASIADLQTLFAAKEVKGEIVVVVSGHHK